jgi:pimeloyl-ACP methyl ester carboxylesterase
MRLYSQLLYCMWAVLLMAVPAAGQQAPATVTAYTTFIRGTPVGREDVTIRSDNSGFTVTSQGRVGPPTNLTIERAEFKYGPDGSPQSFELKASRAGVDASMKTTVTGGNATTEVAPSGSLTKPIAPQAIMHVNGLVGSYIVLADRLGSTAPGGQLRLFVIPETPVDVRIVNVQNDRMQRGNEFVNARRYEIVIANPGTDAAATVTTGTDGSLLSVRIPSQGLDVVRADLAASTSRTQIHSNPGDEPVTIAAVGFNIGATVTRPGKAPADGRFPAVILLGGSAANDRDGYAAGIPVIGQLAGQLADAGILTVRYDKRGYAASGGRAESAGLADYAEDARLVMRWLSERKDVDPRRIALVGYGDGAWVALLAASREKRFAAIVTLAAPSSAGAEFVLEQQQQSLDALNLTPEERDRRVALQKQINTAVQSGKGLADLPPEVRKQADTTWFESLLTFNPTKVLSDVKQPLLIVHGALDRQITVDHADRLAAIAQKQSDSKSIEVVVVKGVNHLLVPAITGEVREYGARAPAGRSRLPACRRRRPHTGTCRTGGVVHRI